jgi:endonuclease-3
LRPAEKVRSLAQHARHASSSRTYVGEHYPGDVIDIVIFHKLHLSLDAASALRSYEELRSHFVDWNEVRVSSVREIQSCLKPSESSLELAVFIKDFLEFVHRQEHRLSLEFLVDQNLTEIRRYLKQVNGIESSTIDMILRLRKAHPVLPLSPAMEAVLQRLGVTRSSQSRDQRQKKLHDLVEPERGLSFHHFVLDHSHTTCPPQEEGLDCPHCRIRSLCAYYGQVTRGGRAMGEVMRPARTGRSRSRSSRRKVMRKPIVAKRARRK